MDFFFSAQILPYLLAMKSFQLEDILIVGYDIKLKIIDCQYIGEQNNLYSSGIDKMKLTKIMSNKNYKHLLIAHNHPNASALPSDEDIEFTAQICSLCKDMKINFLDHLIISANPPAVFSFKKSSLL